MIIVNKSTHELIFIFGSAIDILKKRLAEEALDSDGSESDYEMDSSTVLMEVQVFT